MLDLDEIRRRLAGYAPRTVDPASARRAAVSVVLRPGAGEPDLLFIERARHPGDPWSGQMAFPGGRVDPGDPTTRSAAERETWEEVGLDLARGEPLGRLDDLEGRHAGRPAGLVISAFVYELDAPPPLRPNREVREAMWVPLGALVDPKRHVHYVHPLVPDELFPGIVVGDPRRHVVWGLTYRFLVGFFDALGQPLRHEARERVVCPL